MLNQREVPRIISSIPAISDPSWQADCANSPFIELGNNFVRPNEMAGTISINSLFSANFYTLGLNDSAYVVCYNTRSRAVVLNKAAQILASFFNEPHYLDDIPSSWRQSWGDEVVQSTLLHLIAMGLIIPPDEDFLACSADTSINLAVWLHITDRCNLRCTYCYLPHAKVDMSHETGYAAVKAAFRSALANGYSSVQLKYAGGEPLLCFDLVANLHQRAQLLANRHGLNVNGIVLSNGTLLTPQIVEKIKSLGLHLQISLDGFSDFHDRQRFYANGRGSAKAAVRAVNFALDNGLTPGITVTISKRNIDGLPELMSWILEHDLPFNLSFYRENDFSKSHADLKLGEEKIIQGMRTVYKVIEAALPRRCLLDSLVDRANLYAPHFRTCGVGQDYLVFDYLGQVSKCQMQLDKPVTNVHADDPLAEVRADKNGIHNISVDDKEGCRSCEWKYWCAGGCPLVTYRSTGRYDIKSPNCNIYKALYPEAMRLEGLRLLKYYKK